MTVVEVTLETFHQEVAESEQPVLVDFWAPWCGPCRAVAPVLDAIAVERAGELRVVKVNVDEEPELAAQYAVSSIPAILRLERGEVVAASVGAASKARLEKALCLTTPSPTGRGRTGRLRRLLSRRR